VSDDERTPLDELFDLVVYAPLGLLSNLRAELPRLAEKGRQEWTSKTTMYKFMGQFAVKEGQKRAEKLVRDAAGRAGASGPSSSPRPGAPSAPSDPAPTPPPAPPAAPGTAATNGSRPKPDAGGLAIPGYDSLSASQVVQRLAGLDHDELAAVRDYENATRARRTILNRIAQLQSS
jgi:hypothetical protein